MILDVVPSSNCAPGRAGTDTVGLPPNLADGDRADRIGFPSNFAGGVGAVIDFVSNFSGGAADFSSNFLFILLSFDGRIKWESALSLFDVALS